MRNLLLCLVLFIVTNVNAQETLEQQKKVIVLSSVTKDYQPDFIKVNVCMKEYENIDPENQKATSVKITSVEQSIYKKIEELNIKQNNIEVVNINENFAMQNMYGNNLNYNTTQKRELIKTISFSVNSLKELEKIFVALRINGVSNISAQPFFSKESQIKIENELLSIAMEKAKNKAIKLETLLGKKVGEIITIEEDNNANEAAIAMNYNYYYTNNNYLNIGLCTKSLNIKVTYQIN